MMMSHVTWGHLATRWHQYRFMLSPLGGVNCVWFSFIIPTIRRYIGPSPKRLRFIIVMGMLIPLLFIVVASVTIGVVPLTGDTFFCYGKGTKSRSHGAVIGVFIS